MKGQSSLEFLGYVAMSGLMLAVLHGVMVDRQTAAVSYQTDQSAGQVLEKASFEVEMALVQGDGYSRVFTLPDSIAGHDYEIRIVEGRASLEYSDETVRGSSRYSGDEISIQTDNTNVFRVMNDGGEISLEEAG